MVEESSPSGGGVTVAIKGLDLFLFVRFHFNDILYSDTRHQLRVME